MCSSRRLAALCLPLVFSFACVEHALMETMKPTEHEIPVAAPPPPPEDGALWRGATASGSFLYFDRKARGAGDLVTVMLVENLSAEGSAMTSLDRQSELGATLSSDVGLADVVVKGFDKLLSFIGLDAEPGALPGAELAVIQSRTEQGFEGDGLTNRESSFRGVVTCRVVETLPGGLFRIYGRRRILLNHEIQLVTLEGLVRRADIGIDNTVPSAQVADLQLSFDGIGVLDDEQRPPLFGRFLAWLYPF